MGPAAVESIRSNRDTFYIYGILEYEDLGTGRSHSTKFCQSFEPSGGTLIFCPKYNEAN